jgi:hypothetical protein
MRWPSQNQSRVSARHAWLAMTISPPVETGWRFLQY